TDVAHQFFLATFAVVIHFRPVTFIQNINIKAFLIARFFKEELRGSATTALRLTNALTEPVRDVCRLFCFVCGADVATLFTIPFR
ncbi:hypothetical protein MJM99_31415, partial [Salmonella enterica subsp. enterica serovar Kentucky]|nr:hypothetical protein [Salmonella enterica subsp. enterica serovar Kentucky]